ncbi:MAG TPA: CoA ester lyase [Steroidobacteraceae bacterium]|jgi:citrate lyase subunit beta/citryl-CoA lyase
MSGALPPSPPAGTRLLRSFLFVPGDSERKQLKALETQADALILDLEDSVAPEQVPAARARVRDLLHSHPDRSRQELWVRVNSLASGTLLDDVVAVFPGFPSGIVLPKVNSAAELAQVHHYLTALEAQHIRAPASTKIMAIVTETPTALLNLPRYPEALAELGAREPESTRGLLRERLFGLTWGQEDLSAAVGATAKVDANGQPTFTFQLARTLCLTCAAASEVQAIDGIEANFRDAAGLQRAVAAARRDGFTGKMAIHPDQIALINEAFSPTEAELARARRIVAAFAASPGAGVLSYDGEMLDRPHLIQARRVLALAERAGPPAKG